MNIVAAHDPNNPFRKALVTGLVTFNNQHGPLERWRYVGFYALDEDQSLVGGIQGDFQWNWLHITHLWVKERKQGLGRTLVSAVEAFAQEQNMTGIFLDTFEFQARPFYEKMGFSVFGDHC